MSRPYLPFHAVALDDQARMLTNPIRRYSQYSTLPPSPYETTHHHPLTQTHLHAINVDPFAHGTPYPVHHMQQPVELPNPRLLRSSPHPRQRQNSVSSTRKGSTVSGPIRRRISRACDQCNQLRTKCDGLHPCAHCIEFALGCEYARERKKRGKASRKDLAAQQAAQAASKNAQTSPEAHGEQNEKFLERQGDSSSNGKDLQPLHQSESHGSIDEAVSALSDGGLHPHPQSIGSLHSMEEPHGQPQMEVEPSMMAAPLENHPTLALDGYGSVPRAYENSVLNGSSMYGHQHSMQGYGSLPYAPQTQSPTNFNGEGNFRLSTGGIHDYQMANSSSPSWGVSVASPPTQFHMNIGHGQNLNPNDLRYPVLEPLLPHLASLLPVSLACDLIDLYFSSSSSAQMHPMSPYVLGFVFRKRAFLHPTNPRRCQPALLASMLWVAAQTSDAPFLTSLPSARIRVCQKLLELTINLLQPLIHTGSNDPSPKTSPIVGPAALGALGVALPGSINLDTLAGETGAFGSSGSLDDVITYVHLATVVSASEYKGASLRWWGAAWSLARELKLGRELPYNTASNNREDSDSASEEMDEHDMSRNNAAFASEEEREERRRVWWLVYIVDRHLALCYNRPLFLLDSECDRLYHPMDDGHWQSGRFPSHGTGDDADMEEDQLRQWGWESVRARGPNFECRGRSIFGYFLPLMTILGEIVDIHHAKSHPRFGVGFRPANDWDDQVAEVSRHLETYKASLARFEQKYLYKGNKDKEQQNGHDAEKSGRGGSKAHGSNGVSTEMDIQSPHSIRTNASNRITESEIQASIAIAYSTHVMNVLHVLLEDKWDPINLLDDNDLWISSQGFVTATSHAVSAAEAISQILEFDPGLEFMPFFFGVYLLQGSFLLLLIADKLEAEASANVVKACETIVRAHEACVVTLNTEYQRNFSRVMRSALAVVRGRVPEDLAELQHRRRELLGLYRWSGNGTGLAL